MTAPKGQRRPKKPKGSPLTASGNGQWAARVDGRMINLGPWSDHEGAKQRYYEMMAAGESVPAEPSGRMTVRRLSNEWLDSQNKKLEKKRLSQRSFDDNLRAGKRLVRVFGPNRELDSLKPKDWAKLRKDIEDRHESLHSIRREMVLCKAAANYGVANRMILAPFFGTEFTPPSDSEIAKDRADRERENGGGKHFEAEEIRQILEIANPTMTAMILLGINCGLGNEDILELRKTDINLATGWLHYPRPKNGIERRAKMWPETSKAIKDYLELRPEPQPDLENGAKLVFLTRYGNQYDALAIGKEFNKLQDKVGCKRKERSYYGLRHTLQTEAENLAEESPDVPAIDRVMGHKTVGIATNYRGTIADKRLEKISDALHRWLFGSTAKTARKKTTKKAKSKSSKKSKRKAG